VRQGCYLSHKRVGKSHSGALKELKDCSVTASLRVAGGQGQGQGQVRCPAGHLKRKGTIRHGSPLLEARSPSDELFIARFGARTYVACTTTAFVWISSVKLDGGLVQPRQLWSTRRGAMHSPSGSLLTTRVNMFLLTGEALTVTSQTLSSYSSTFDRFKVPLTRVGHPTLVVRTEPQRRFGFSKPA